MQNTVKDVTKPWKRKFFEVKKIADTPQLNASGFWDKSKLTSEAEAKRQLENAKRGK